MHKNMKNALVYFLAAVIVIAAASVPFVYFHIQDTILFSKEHKRRTIQTRLDPVVEEMYVSRAVKDAYLLGAPMVQQRQKDSIGSLNRELSVLRQTGVYVPDTIDVKSVTKRSFEIPNTNGPGGWYNAARFEFKKKGTVYAVEFYLAPQTNTLLYFSMSKSIFQTELIQSQTDEHDEKGSDLKPGEDLRSARAASKYLELDFVNDWVETNEGLSSEKAQMRIHIIREKDRYLYYAEPMI